MEIESTKTTTKEKKRLIVLCGNDKRAKKLMSEILYGEYEKCDVDIKGEMSDVLLNILFGFPISNKDSPRSKVIFDIPTKKNEISSFSGNSQDVIQIEKQEIKEKGLQHEHLEGEMTKDTKNENEKNEMWNITKLEAKEKLQDIIKQTLNPEFCFPPNTKKYRFSCKLYSKPSYMRINIEDPLIKAASVVFKIPYETLLGETLETKKKRKLTYVNYPLTGQMNGKQCLKFFGTEMLRNKFHFNFWDKLWKKSITDFMNNGYNIITSDCKYSNELILAEELQATIICIIKEHTIPVAIPTNSVFSYLEYIYNTKYKVNFLYTLENDIEIVSKIKLFLGEI